MTLMSHDDLEAATRPLSRARSMPSDFYVSPAIFAAERAHIFLKSWFFLCREEMLPNPGDYRAFDTVGGPVLLIRGSDGKLRAFANYCRHRGSILLEGEGSCQRIVCPYHAWSYLTDGRLYGCPDMADAEGFDRVENGLVPVRLESWAGFLFATFDSEAPDLLTHLGDLPQWMASHRPADFRCTWRIELEPQCNWKFLLENALETYHTGVVHKTTVGAQTSRSLATVGQWLCLQVLSTRSIGTLQSVAPPLPQIEGLDDDARLGTYFTLVHPTCQLVFAQDCAWWLNVLPLSHDRSRLEIGGAFPASTVALPDFAERAAPYYDRWEKVGREDVGILEKQQKALGSVLYRPGPLSGRDDLVQSVGKWVLSRLPADIAG